MSGTNYIVIEDMELDEIKRSSYGYGSSKNMAVIFLMAWT